MKTEKKERSARRNVDGYTPKQVQAMPYLTAMDSVSAAVEKCGELGIVTPSFFWRSWWRDPAFKGAVLDAREKALAERAALTADTLERAKLIMLEGFIEAAQNLVRIALSKDSGNLRAIEDMASFLGLDAGRGTRVSIKQGITQNADTSVREERMRELEGKSHDELREILKERQERLQRLIDLDEDGGERP